jgi:hypothetical protein
LKLRNRIEIVNTNSGLLQKNFDIKKISKIQFEISELRESGGEF